MTNYFYFLCVSITVTQLFVISSVSEEGYWAPRLPLWVPEGGTSVPAPTRPRRCCWRNTGQRPPSVTTDICRRYVYLNMLKHQMWTC